jgi:hypothetical protein
VFAEVEAQRRRLDGHRPFGQDALARLHAVLEPWFVYSSNALGGSSLTLGDTIYLIRERRLPAGKSEEEYLEVKGQQDGYGYLHQALEDRVELCEPLVRELHKLLTQRLDQARYRPGQYKQPDGAASSGPSAAQVVKRLCDWYHDEGKALHPIERAAWLHQKLMLIHPFRDGNGRTARLLANLALLQAGHGLVVFRAGDRLRNYHEALRSTEASVMYHRQELGWSYQLALDALEGRLPLDSDELVLRFGGAEARPAVSGPVPVARRLPPPPAGASPDDTILDATITLDVFDTPPSELALEAVKKLTRRVGNQVNGICAVLNRGWTELRADNGQELGAWRDVLDDSRLRDLELEPRTLRLDAGVVWVVLKRRPSSLTPLLVPANRFELCAFSEPHTLCLASIRHLTTSGASLTNTACLRLDLAGTAWRAVEVERFVIEQLNLFLGATEDEVDNLNGAARRGADR